MSRRASLYALLAVAATMRLALQLAAMPPYAGLDELFHVARIAFVAQEHRNPRAAELSIPRYLESSIEQKWDALPAFAIIGPDWPRTIASNRNVAVARPLTPDRTLPYLRANYEAQQPSLYYSAAAPLRPSTDLGELRVLRFVALLCGVAIVLATAFVAERWFGSAGIVAAALIVSIPTWLTLIVRAGNDALACAFVAIAFACTASNPKRPAGWIAESLAWSLAVATKLYTWPAAIVVPLFWWKQLGTRARGESEELRGTPRNSEVLGVGWRRVALILTATCVAAAWTLADLHARTHTPLGLFPFAQAAGVGHARIGEIVRVTLATAVWTSGQHNDAMRPLAMALYVIPILCVLAIAQRRNARLGVAFAALATFGIAQLVAIAITVATGHDTPVGKEGWYWYVLVPVVVSAIVPPALRMNRAMRVALVSWVVAWDVVIHECRVFHDWAGTGSPLHGDAWFRWGPLHAPFTAELATIGTGPFAAHLGLLRAGHVAAVVALVMMEALFARELS